LLKIAKDLNKKVTVWQDVYDNGVVVCLFKWICCKKILISKIDYFIKLDKSTQVQIWKDTNTLPEHKKWYEYLSNITRDGYSAILSSPWYINFVSYGYQEWYNYYKVEVYSL
jgi:hypothetical protein